MRNGPTSKAALRSALVAARRLVPPAKRDAEAAALREHLLGIVDRGSEVCAYVPVGSEPGSVAMLDALVAASVRVLLPVARDVAGEPQPLQWGPYRPDDLVAAAHGLREPAAPWLPATAIAAATTVIVPALAVDWHGARLGRGAGFYDRSLPLADSAARLIAIVRDDELLEHLPSEAHDVPMTHALTPARGVVALGT